MPATFSSAALAAARAPVLLRNSTRLPRTLPTRLFTTAALRSQARASLQSSIPKRLGTVSVLRPYSATAQSAPNPRAYLESGVIRPKQTVDVKKVLVIGSGGLAIGQAGEFDYSGKPSSLVYSSFCGFACSFLSRPCPRDE